MAKLLVVDPLLTTPEFGVGPGWLGSEHEVITPGSYDVDDLAPLLADAAVLLTAHYPVTAQMLAHTRGLGLVAKPGAGVDNIDVAAATQRGVVVTNVPGARGRAVAEHAMFMLLYLVRHAWMRGDPAWKGTSGLQLGGKTLGIVGYGDIGTKLVRMGAGFDMRVLVHSRTADPTRTPDVEVTFVDRDELYRRSDALILCMPLTPQTQAMIDEKALRAMKPTAILVNVSRGPAVVTDDLLTVMSQGHLHSAGLDVTDPEPLPSDHGLWHLPNVLISPHNAGRTRESQQAALSRMRENVETFLDGGRPPDQVSSSGPSA